MLGSPPGYNRKSADRVSFRFRWAELQLALFFNSKYRLRHSKDVENKLQALEKKTGLPELDSVYSEIYEMNTNEGSESRAVAVRVFKWILSAYRPLKLSELSYAAALQDDGVADPEVNNDFVLDVCSNFVTIDTSDHVQFAHASVRDFLEDLKLEDSRVYSKRMIHTQAAKTCLIYLTGNMFLSAPENVLDTGFPAYVRRYWANHCEACEDNRNEDSVLQTLLVNFLSAKEVHPGFQRWHECVADTLDYTSADLYWDPRNSAERSFVWSDPYKKRNTEVDGWKPELIPFFLASVIADEERRSENQAMRNSLEFWSYTSLSLACQQGLLDVALALLEKGASADERDFYGRTPLHFAVNIKNEALVRILLEAGANVDSEDDSGWRPLSIAANRGYVPLVRMLLDFHANPACLELAIKERQGDIARLLWDAGARIRPANPRGHTSSPTRYRSANDLFSLAKQIERIEHDLGFDTDSETSQRYPDTKKASDDTDIEYHTSHIDHV